MVFIKYTNDFFPNKKIYNILWLYFIVDIWFIYIKKVGDSYQIMLDNQLFPSLHYRINILLFREYYRRLQSLLVQVCCI